MIWYLAQSVSLDSGWRTKVTVFFNILNRCAAALQTGDSLHPVDGFFVKNTAVPLITPARQEANVGIVTNGIIAVPDHLFIPLITTAMRYTDSFFPVIGSM